MNGDAFLKVALAIAQAVILAAIMGAYSFAWSINSRVTLLETATDEDHARSHWLLECKARILPECQPATGMSEGD